MTSHGEGELAHLREEAAELAQSIAEVPLLRGVSHLAAFFVAVAGGIVLVLQADLPVQLAGALIYSLGMALALGTSAVYHRVKWAPRAKAIMRNVDHSMIFVFFACTSTPVFLLSLEGSWRIGGLVAMWVLATAGVVMRVAVPNLPRALLVASYLGLGWAMAVLMPQLYVHAPRETFLLLVVGGILYTAGAFIFLFRRPDPIPRIFGYHEVFHVLVIAAAACHYAAVYPLVTGTTSA